MKKILVLILLLAPAFAWAGDTPKPNVYKTIASELLKDCTGTDKAVAVAGFSYSDGRDSRDGGVVAERITTELVKLKKFKVIERKEIEKVFAELKFQRSGAITPDSAKEIGQLLGADYVVVGAITELADKQLELSARLVGVESGEIIAASSGKVTKDWLDQYKKLIAEQNKTIEKNSKDGKTFYDRGVVYTDLREYDNAIASFGLAIGVNPAGLEAYYARGKVYALKGEYNKAIEDCSKAVAINPKYADGHNCLGIAYRYMSEYDKAIENYSMAIAIDPKHDGAYTNRGNAYSDKGEYDKAIENYSMAIAIDPKDAWGHINRGKAYSNKGEYDKAIEDYSKAIAIYPKLAGAYIERAVAYRAKGESGKSANDYQKFLSLSQK